MMAGITYDLCEEDDNGGAGFCPLYGGPASPLWTPAKAGVTVAVDGGERRAPDIGVASRYRRRSRIGVRDMLS